MTIAVAFLNHGRWILECPREFCTNAFLAVPGVASHTCGNCGLTFTIEHPAPELKTAVETITARRPVPATRNWYPWETLEALKLENEQHGVDSP